jgi:glutamate--cysteine ligase
MRTWLQLDHARTAPPLGDSADPIRDYAAWAVDVPLLCVRRADSSNWSAPPGATFADWVGGGLDDELGRRPDTADLDYHLTTIFPPIRAAGHLEVRYIDAQPGRSWDVPIYAIDALMSSPAVIAEATALAAPTAPCWLDAAEHGLADSEIRSAATSLLSLATAYSPNPAKLDTAAKRCRRGIDPARQEYAA